MWAASRVKFFAPGAFPRTQGGALCSPALGASTRGLASSERFVPAKFEMLVPAVQAFHARFGHFVVPYNFRIAADDAQWPTETRDLNMGRRLHSFMANARYQKRLPAVVEQLQRLGFPVERDYRRLVWEKRTLAALEVFHRLHGHSLVPVGFVVPSPSSLYPRETWGFELGVRVAKLRLQRDRLSDQELQDLECVAFSFNVDETHWRTKILPALKAFKKTFGHEFVKRGFVVPDTDEWPVAARGLRLRLVVYNIRNHNAYRDQVEHDKDELMRNGMVYLCGSPEDEWNMVVLPALLAFKQVHGHANVPVTFVVPVGDPWPRATWGFGLGQLVHTEHSLDLFHEQVGRDRQILEDIGAKWFATLDDKWEQFILPALHSYATIVGVQTQIPQSFVVPNASPWPKQTWDLRLGVIATRIRRNRYPAQMTRDAEQLKSMQLDRVLGVDL